MAKKADSTDSSENTGTTETTNAAVATPVVEEATPDRGGSFTRNADGSLTQTEGHGFAHDLLNNQE